MQGETDVRSFIHHFTASISCFYTPKDKHQLKGYNGNANPRHAEPQETPSSHDPLSTSQSDLLRVSNVKTMSQSFLPLT